MGKTAFKTIQLFGFLIEDSSLRQDLLSQISDALKDILDNIELTDELCSRVNSDTYEFIKDWKEGRNARDAA